MIEDKNINRKFHFVLTAHWFDEIISGKKKTEYRNDTPFWRKRLCKAKIGDIAIFHKGYTKNPSISKTIKGIRYITNIPDENANKFLINNNINKNNINNNYIAIDFE